MIPHSRPTLGPEDAEALRAALDSGRIAQGPRVAAFERAVAERLGRGGAVAVSSGTAALAVALAGLGVGPGDEVVLPAYACAALGHAVRFVGASAVLADVDEGLALAPRQAARRFGARTRAVVVVHPFGHPVDIAPFLERGVPVVEDCAQALGASRGGRPAGALGAAAVCSFYATKMVAAGEGGMVLADDPAILAAARRTRACGFNVKMSDLAAALGLAQLARLGSFVARRREVAARYDAAFVGTAVRAPARDCPAEPCFSRYVVRVPDAAAFVAALAERGVEAKRAVADPLVARADPADFPESARAFAECASLPIYPSLDDEGVDRVIEAVEKSRAEMGWIR